MAKLLLYGDIGLAGSAIFGIALLDSSFAPTIFDAGTCQKCSSGVTVKNLSPLGLLVLTCRLLGRLAGPSPLKPFGSKGEDPHPKPSTSSVAVGFATSNGVMLKNGKGADPGCFRRYW